MNGERSAEYSPKFLRKLARLPKQIIEQAREKERIFRQDPFDLRLGTHKLHGEHRDEWAFSITRKYRIKFIFVTNQIVLFTDVGTHDEVY